MERWAAAALALAMAIAGCSPPAATRQDNAAAIDAGARTDRADAANATGNDAPPSKSILRPEVIEAKPEAPALKPIDAIIPFASGAVLDDAGRAAIDGVLADPAMRAGGAITLRGHSDSRGNDRDNLIASRRRAEAVRAYLEKAGVAADRITIVALGETRPIAPNANLDGSDDPAGRARNRRVELVVDLPPQSAPDAPDAQGNAQAPANAE